MLIRAVESGQLPAATSVDDAVAELAGPLIYMRLMTNERPREGFIARLVDRYLIDR